MGPSCFRRIPSGGHGEVVVHRRVTGDHHHGRRALVRRPVDDEDGEGPRAAGHRLPGGAPSASTPGTTARRDIARSKPITILSQGPRCHGGGPPRETSGHVLGPTM